MALEDNLSRLDCIRTRANSVQMNTVYQNDVRTLLSIIEDLLKRNAGLVDEMRVMRAIDANSRKSFIRG